ncbi:hypothetical protein [Streptomyces sp. NPDC059819]|uniref:hypothetical protein n=1 Tax=Streptomyces sp. NPDC059819 TaxID=3346963 RepID=UPI003660363A
MKSELVVFTHSNSHEGTATFLNVDQAFNKTRGGRSATSMRTALSHEDARRPLIQGASRKTQTRHKDTSMSTQTVAKTGTTAPTSTAAKKTAADPVKEQRTSKLRTGWRRLAPKEESGRFSVMVWTGFFRAIVLLADYVLAFITATAVIPLLGAWLHQRSGASRGALGADGTIAMWLMPLFFLVALLVAGEIVMMRGMWHWATRRVAKIRGAWGERAGADVTPKSTARTTNRSRANRKRSQ